MVGCHRPPPPPPPPRWDPEVDAELAAALGAERWARLRAALATPPPRLCLRVNGLHEQKGEALELLRAAAASAGLGSVAVAESEALGPRVLLVDVVGPRGALRLGVGIVRAAGTSELVAPGGRGVAVEIVHGLYAALPLERLQASLPAGLLEAQALPSVVAARALEPVPGDDGLVLDMCAGEGGKTAEIVALMGGTGRLVAVDRSARKLDALRARLDELGGAACVRTVAADATKALDDGAPCAGDPAEVAWERAAAGRKQRFPPGAFRRILVDAPCTATGLRPRLESDATVRSVAAAAETQRAMLAVAAALLEPGGTLVYSTCSITPHECERNVRLLLDARPELRLDAGKSPRVGGPGVQGPRWLSAEEAALVQRFDDESCGTMGFFCARFASSPSRP